MAAADGSKLVTVGLLGGLGYLLYRYLSPAPAPAVSSGPAAPAAGPAPATPTPAPVAYNSLDQIFQRLQASLAANNVPQVQGQFVANPWQFNYFLVRVSNVTDLPIGGADLWPGIDANNPPQITLPQFWGTVAPWLSKNKGFSGFAGLGFYGSLFRRARPIRA